MNTYLIYDWAGNLKFNGQSFDTFEDAWEYLYERFETDEDLGEFYVKQKGNNHD